MIIIQNTVISDDVRDNFFVCNLEACKGACCVEGDLGAPLEAGELQILEQEYAAIKPFLTEAGQQAIEQQGLYIKDWEGDYSTTTINDRECAYALYDERGILKCGIEQAYLAGATSFKKPISCHLYPIRITKYEDFDALNYDRWNICNPACSFGANLGVRIYQFLKEPLVRKYGEEWYGELVHEIEHGTPA
ncbi:DUF3109 family protein [Hymenobacter taeanensis]|uniref:DUF3109 family protein n=1 Tax=Hymenobacter taeanensis TaxID=2735321 RepID=A0A6M6BJN6_9BACT|nr:MULTISPECIES: DUF3109 family protein [Hymenobacter]QJX48317.1 DUF3109 family protein [Hymenobacter taeanensis]UOQ82192.1 DUF3109 family protein [Hymenobacter sp. 5414T-23]